MTSHSNHITSIIEPCLAYTTLAVNAIILLADIGNPNSTKYLAWYHLELGRL